MIEINVRLRINASREKVWDIISKVNDDQRYWRGISAIRNLTKNRNVITREVSFVNNSKCHQKITLFPKEGIHVRWTSGPIVGIKDILLTGNNVTILEVQIRYRLSGVVRIVPKSILNELRFEAELASQLIKKEAESSPIYPVENRKVWADLIND
jgi:hypothetical protein